MYCTKRSIRFKSLYAIENVDYLNIFSYSLICTYTTLLLCSMENIWLIMLPLHIIWLLSYNVGTPSIVLSITIYLLHDERLIILGTILQTKYCWMYSTQMLMLSFFNALYKQKDLFYMWQLADSNISATVQVKNTISWYTKKW